MRRFTSILTWIWAALLGASLSVLNLVLWPIANPWVDPRRRVAERVNGLWGSGILGLAPEVRVERSGRDLAADREVFVVCANHQSVVDVIVLLALFPHLKFVAKRGIFRIPLIGLSMSIAGYLTASAEGQGPEQFLVRATRWLALGCRVLTFPEGTRSADGTLRRFHQGPVILAQRGGVRLLPIAISGTRNLLPKHGLQFLRRGTVTVQVLEPMSAAGEPKQVAAEMRRRIQAALDAPRASVPARAESLDTEAVAG